MGKKLCARCLQAFDDGTSSEATTCPGCREQLATPRSESARSATQSRRASEVLAGTGELRLPPSPLERLAADTMLGRVGETLLYPVRPGSLGIFLLIVVFFVFLLLVSNFAFFPVSLILHVIAYGGILGWFQKIISESTTGRERIALWPKWSNIWDDSVLPFVQVMGTSVAVLLPGLAVGAIAHSGLSLSPLVSALLAAIPILAGLAYLPMALLAVAVFGSVQAISPRVVVPSIRLVKRDYAIVCALLATVIGLRLGVHWLAGHLGPLQGAVGVVADLYFLAILGRFIGLIYYDHQAELRWFNR